MFRCVSVVLIVMGLVADFTMAEEEMGERAKTVEVTTREAGGVELRGRPEACDVLVRDRSGIAI